MEIAINPKLVAIPNSGTLVALAIKSPTPATEMDQIISKNLRRVSIQILKLNLAQARKEFPAVPVAFMIPDIFYLS